MELIDGVRVKELEVYADQRGRVMEVLRADDEIFQGFGQVYITTTLPGVVKAWHLHKLQTDNVACAAGMIRLGLYDDREGSPTRGQANQVYLGVHSPLLVQIPPGVYHGWKCVSLEEALIVNAVTVPYNPDKPDEYRLDPRDPSIPWDWDSRDG